MKDRRGQSTRATQTSKRIVRDLILSSIRHGALSTATSLVEHELVAHLGASRSAIRAALQALAEEGLVSRRQRLGTFATNNAIRLNFDEMVSGSIPSSVTGALLAERMVTSTPLLEELLETDDHQFRMLDVLVSFNGVPVGVSTAYFRPNHVRVSWKGSVAIADAAPALVGSSTWTSVHAELGATKADPQTARLLGLKTGGPMLTRSQVYADAGNKRVAVAFEQFRGDLVSLVKSNKVDGRDETAALGSLSSKQLAE